MRWLRHSIVVLGMVSGLALLAGGCDYDDHYHHHDYYRERPVGYRYDPYHYDRWRHDHYGDRRYDGDWDHDRDWRHDRW